MGDSTPFVLIALLYVAIGVAASLLAAARVIRTR
jgi:hypothetical protein